jgi:hypothetical protein
MQGIRLVLWLRRGLWILFLVGLSGGCGLRSQSTPSRQVQVQQTWALQAGSEVNGYLVSSGLGDIALDLQGDAVYMPFNGKVELGIKGCVILSSSEVPAYLFRLCGLKRPRLGQQGQGELIGKSEQLVFATLRKQPDGTWTIVEPSKQFLQQLLKAS